MIDRIKFTFKYNGFVYTTQTCGNEGHIDCNKDDLQKNTETYFKDGKIFNKSTDQQLPQNNMLYVFHKNILYVNNNINLTPTHDSIIIDPILGIGLPVACGGYLKINSEGKITAINNASGHYTPSEEQLALVAKYLGEQGVLDEYFVLKSYDGEELDPQKIDTASILDNCEEFNFEGALLGETLDLTDN